MYPFVKAGLFGINDAIIRPAIMPKSKNVGTGSVTFVLTSDTTGSLYFLNRIRNTGTVAIAPSSTAQNMPGRPSIQKKSKKSSPP